MSKQNADQKTTKKAVHIGERHLNTTGARKNLSDNKVPGFVLRTSPDTFYFQFLNKGTGKREWYLIGKPPHYTVETARNEARGLAKLVADDGDLRMIRQQTALKITAGGITFQQLFDAYIADCQRLIPRPWGVVAQKESHEQIAYALTRPLAWWGKRPATSITKHDVKALYASFVDEGHIPQANRVRTMLHTMFKWGASEKDWITVNPCAALPAKLENPNSREDGKALNRDELHAFWFGIDKPGAPGDRLSHLLLKLSLVTLLRTGELCKAERTGWKGDFLHLPLSSKKSRRVKKVRATVQPLNSLAKEILAEVVAIGDPDRKYLFPAHENDKSGRGHLDQRSLGSLLRRRTTDATSRLGLCEFLGLTDVTPHDCRRTGGTILEQLDYSDADIGKVMSHKPVGKEASPVTREHYLVPVQIVLNRVDKRVGMLDHLDATLREILGLNGKKKKSPSKLALVA